LRQIRCGDGWGETCDVQSLPYNGVGVRFHFLTSHEFFKARGMIEIG
jgi:hypothetical protein